MNLFQKRETQRIKCPTKHDINNLNIRANRYDKDDMIDVKDWNGGCFKTLFEQVAVEQAKEIGVDPWDYFAALIHKIYGR